MHDPVISRRKGKGVRRAPCGARKRVSQAPINQKDPLTKLRVFKDMKKSKSKGKAKMEGKGKHARTDSSSTDDHSISDIEEVLEDDERMDLSDIEWYTRQDFDDFDEEPRTPTAKARKFDDEEDDDLEMSEVELDVLASPMCISPSPKRTQRTAFQVPPNPVISVPEINGVPVCLYRPTADIIEEVYNHLGLSMSDHRGIRVLKDLLDTSSTGITKPKSSRYEVGSSGIFPNRPTAAKDWAALSLTRKIIRRDRLAKSAIYRFTFRYPKDEVPARFLKWQTWNHPTLAEIKQGLRFKLEERAEEVVVEEEAASIPSSPAMVESELDDIEDVPEIDDILSVASELEEEDEGSVSVDMSEYAETEVTPEMDDTGLTETESEVDEAEEDEQFFHALGLTGVPEYESPGAPIRESPRGAPIYSRLSRERDSDSPPNYAPRNYRDQSPTPPPPFNAQTDNDVIILPRFSPLALVPTTLPLLPAFEMTTITRRVISPLPTPERRTRSTRTQRRIASGEIVIPGAFARHHIQNRTPPTPTPASRRAADESFQHALDMEEAETALELLQPELDSPEAPSGVIGWGASVVRSWWRR
jgi:hypothetical protein